LRNLADLFTNRILWAAAAAWLTAQIIKILLDMWRHKSVNWRLITSSGGMPSSHTSSVVAMTAAVGFAQGFGSVAFAVSTVVSMVVMYDAAGVRRAAGKQAEVINQLVTSLENSGVKLDKQLKELLGHSPVEVFAGAILGVLVGCLFTRGLENLQ